MRPRPKSWNSEEKLITESMSFGNCTMLSKGKGLAPFKAFPRVKLTFDNENHDKYNATTVAPSHPFNISFFYGKME